MTESDKRTTKLKMAVYESLIASPCTPEEAIEALLTLAAGRAIVSGHSCEAFVEKAHGLFHAASDVIGNVVEVTH